MAFSFLKLYSPQAMLANDLERLLAQVPKSATLRILDIGSSDGRMWSRGELAQLHKRLAVTLFDPLLADGMSGLRSPIVEHVQGLAPQDLAKLDAGVFDVVVAFDVIEHMPEHQGFLLLYEMERLAKRMCVVYTPTGILWQPPAENNVFNAHVSGWSPRTLRRMGWRRITGIFGFRFLLGPYAQPRFSPKSKLGIVLHGFAMSLSQVLARPVPSFAHSFYAANSSPLRRIARQEFSPDL